MKHKIGFNRLERSAAHRKALHRNMVTSLFKHERITTTKAKALEVRRTAEKMITRAKEDSVHNRRMVSRRLYDEGILAKLFTDIAVRMRDRQGGYTRVVKLGERSGDATEMVILELVDYKFEEKSDKNEKKTSKSEVKKVDKGPAKKAAEKKSTSSSKKSDAKASDEGKSSKKKTTSKADVAEAK